MTPSDELKPLYITGADLFYKIGNGTDWLWLPSPVDDSTRSVQGVTFDDGLALWQKDLSRGSICHVKLNLKPPFLKPAYDLPSPVIEAACVGVQTPHYLTDPQHPDQASADKHAKTLPLASLDFAITAVRLTNLSTKSSRGPLEYNDKLRDEIRELVLRGYRPAQKNGGSRGKKVRFSDDIEAIAQAGGTNGNSSNANIARQENRIREIQMSESGTRASNGVEPQKANVAGQANEVHSNICESGYRSSNGIEPKKANVTGPENRVRETKMSESEDIISDADEPKKANVVGQANGVHEIKMSESGDCTSNGVEPKVTSHEKKVVNLILQPSSVSLKLPPPSSISSDLPRPSNTSSDPSKTCNNGDKPEERPQAREMALASPSNKSSTPTKILTRQDQMIELKEKPQAREVALAPQSSKSSTPTKICTRQDQVIELKEKLHAHQAATALGEKRLRQHVKTETLAIQGAVIAAINFEWDRKLAAVVAHHRAEAAVTREQIMAEGDPRLKEWRLSAHEVATVEAEKLLRDKLEEERASLVSIVQVAIGDERERRIQNGLTFHRAQAASVVLDIVAREKG